KEAEDLSRNLLDLKIVFGDRWFYRRRDCWGLNLEQRLWWKGKLRKYNPWQQSTCLNKRKKAPPVRRRLDVIGNMKYAGEAGIFKMEVSLLTRVLVVI
ncbi:hypothetical protein HID58_059368, partial [Brassica napus]